MVSGNRIRNAGIDQTLMLVSETLKQTYNYFKSPVFLGRCGGDEFTIILQNPEDDDHTERAIRENRSTLSEKRRENRLPHGLEVSAGYDALRDRNNTMQECVVRADKKRYQEKRVKGTVR